MFEVATTHQIRQAQQRAHAERAQAFARLCKSLVGLLKIPLVRKSHLTVALR